MRDFLDSALQWGAGFFPAPYPENRGVLHLCYADYVFLGASEKDTDRIKNKFAVKFDERCLNYYLAEKRFLKEGYERVVLHNFDFSIPDLFTQALTFLDNHYVQLSQAQLTFYQVCQLLDNGFDLQNSTYWIKNAVSFREYIMAYSKYATPSSGMLRQKSLHSVKVDFTGIGEFQNGACLFADDFFACCTPISLAGVRMTQAHVDKIKERFGGEANNMLRGVIILLDTQAHPVECALNSANPNCNPTVITFALSDP